MLTQAVDTILGNQTADRRIIFAHPTKSVTVLSCVRSGNLKEALPTAIDLAHNVDRIGLSHSDLPFQGGSTTGLSAIGGPSRYQRFV
jgi:hypothetical protein